MRPLRPEGGDDGMARGFERAGELLDVGRALWRRREEMKQGAVMPEIKGAWRQLHVRDIADEPVNACADRTEPSAIRETSRDTPFPLAASRMAPGRSPPSDRA